MTGFSRPVIANRFHSDMNTVIARIPVHLDAILLKQDQLTTEAFANFDELPHRIDGEDRHPDIPNLSESVLSKPFQNQNLNLKKGLHLHWSLPDALTKGGFGGTTNDYPAVPNRWLITRKRDGVVDRQWVIESDYLHPVGLPNEHNAIAFPIDTSDSQPFRYMGRKVAYQNWIEAGNHDHLPKLTAIGYGEPAFAAFYPNCHSVFGCFDADITKQEDLQNLSYQLVGWYSDPANDPIAQLVQSNLAENPPKGNSELEQLIKEKLALHLSIGEGNTLSGLSCFADLAFSDLAFQANYDLANEQKDKPVKLSLGNTGTEAFSAFFAKQLHVANQTQFEEQLEHLFLEAGLKEKVLDYSQRFKAARHTNGFRAEAGGSLWELRLTNEPNSNDSSAAAIPPSFTDKLSELNTQQQLADRANDRLPQARHILFADWYKYMLCAYPPEDARDHYPDIDLVKWYIEQKGLPMVKALIAEVQKEEQKAAELLADFQPQVNFFNAGRVPSEKLSLSIKLDDETVSTNGLTLNGGWNWADNKPVSSKCLNFNGSDASVSIAGKSDTKALSCWVKIAASNGDDAPFLATREWGSLLSKNSYSNFWERLIINGKEQRGYLTYPWTALPKDQWFHLYVEFPKTLNSTDVLYLFGMDGTGFASGGLASIRLFNAPLTLDEIISDQNILGHKNYALKEVSAPRFWQVNEPVVLLEGAAAEPSLRHGADGRLREDNSLECGILSIHQSFPFREEINKLVDEIKRPSPPDDDKPAIGYNTWKTQPWHPLFLEWEVELFPLTAGGNLDIENRNYAPSFIESNFELPEQELVLKTSDGVSVGQAAARYTGRSILTSYAKKQFQALVQAWYSQLSEENCFQDVQNPNKVYGANYPESFSTWFAGKPDQDASFQDYLNWYLGKLVGFAPLQQFNSLSPADQLKDYNYALLKAAKEADEKHLISQALSGFNKALLMHHQTLQLPIADPLGFKNYMGFTAEVNKAVANNTNLAPLPLNDFIPIRTGVMQLQQLRLVDTFGQVKQDLSTSRLVRSSPLELPSSLSHGANSNAAWLPPRFVQPARINFRWLSAHSGMQELNDHPQNTPICGWLLANHLDNSLACYDQSGYALCNIDLEARLRSTPGSELVFDFPQISNPHFRKVIERLAVSNSDGPEAQQAKKEFLQAFISVTDDSLEKIAPESFGQHQELALLMGRPIAVVRAAINLELKSDPAVHHGWKEFMRDMQGDTRETDGFEAVKVPIRIGEPGHLNDGVVGYWEEKDGSYLEEVFHTTSSIQIHHPQIKNYQEDPLHLSQSLNDAPTQLTLLFDPRGEAHATTGMLPTKSIDIPKHLYADALKHLNITFNTAPVLTGTKQMALPLPNEMGFEWSWLEKDRHTWSETSRNGVIRQQTVLNAFDNGIAIWQELLNKGWITPLEQSRARIVPVDQRSSGSLAAPINAQADKIQLLLDAGHIVPAQTAPPFDTKTSIKEGWLKLSPLTTTSQP